MSLLKLQCLLKYIIVSNLVVWLHMLSGTCWCMYAALFGTWSCFNVNFNITFLKQFSCASVGNKRTSDHIVSFDAFATLQHTTLIIWDELLNDLVSAS